jgi:rhodanese-related sulfurtransferase
MLGFFKTETGKTINVNEIDHLIGKVNIIDIREPYEYKGGSLLTAKNIPMGDLVNTPGKHLSKDKTYYIMCHSGGRSSRTCNYLAKQGFDVINITGGIVSYSGNKHN